MKEWVASHIVVVCALTTRDASGVSRIGVGVGAVGEKGAVEGAMRKQTKRMGKAS